jgi:hypothetical protein
MAGRGPHPRTRLRRGAAGFPRGARCRQADHRARRQACRGASPPSTPEYSASPAPLTPKMAVVVSTARLLAVRVGAWRCPLRSAMFHRAAAARVSLIVRFRVRVARCMLRVACCMLRVACCTLHVARCTLIMVCRSPPSASSEPIGDDAAADMRSRHVGATSRARTRARADSRTHMPPTRARTRNGPPPLLRTRALRRKLRCDSASRAFLRRTDRPGRRCRSHLADPT